MLRGLNKIPTVAYVGVIFGIWITWSFLPFILDVNRTFNLHYSVEKAGQWGDAFGALNALFAAGAFISVLATLKQQQLQIKQAQDEQHRQRFESSFFELLKILKEIRSSVSFSNSDHYLEELTPYELRKISSLPRNRARYHGNEALKEMAVELKYWLRHAMFPDSQKRSPISKAKYIFYNEIYKKNESELGAYFRILYTILRRISEDKYLSAAEKSKYGNLIRSQLTSHELSIISLNGMLSISNDMKNYLIEFRILKYMPKDVVYRVSQYYYPEEIFEPRD